MTNNRFRVIMAALFGMWVAYFLIQQSSGSGGLESVVYSEFIDQIREGRVKEVVIEGESIRGRRDDGTTFRTVDPGDPGLVGDLLNHDVTIAARPPEEPGLLMQIFASWAPMLILLGVWIWFMRRSMGNGGGILSFGKSRARLHEEGKVKVTLADVAGVDEAKEEVGELVEFLRAPEKFRNLGGKIPRGVLMVGPPGTGKTLLARAIAGEAKVPFFSISGSDFVEMFVGVGASRVRDLFEQAKKSSPCIVFIDEIDAVGRRRGAGLGGGHDEREQTLNQLLVEMDGFEGTAGIIVVAATNRPDVLDPALLRPGRFDRQVVVGLPDVAGREQILRLHMRKVPVGDDVDPRVIARGTPGFSGADLENLVNEAALLSARANQEKVGMSAFEKAKDKILMGSERRSMVMSPEEKRLTAYHEAGHTIVGLLVPDHDPVHKVSIIPRGRALGVTLFLPERDRYSASRRSLESQISTLFGGRIAEELIFGAEAVTTGAQNDIQRATSIARNMVTKWGLSEKLGPLSYEEDDGEVFLGNTVTQKRSLARRTAEEIDSEVREIVDRNYERSKRILTEHIDRLHTMAEALINQETLDKQEIDAIMAGRYPGPERDSSGDDDSKRTGPREQRPSGEGSGTTLRKTGTPGQPTPQPAPGV